MNTWIHDELLRLFQCVSFMLNLIRNIILLCMVWNIWCGVESIYSNQLLVTDSNRKLRTESQTKSTELTPEMNLNGSHRHLWLFDRFESRDLICWFGVRAEFEAIIVHILNDSLHMLRSQRSIMKLYFKLFSPNIFHAHNAISLAGTNLVIPMHYSTRSPEFLEYDIILSYTTLFTTLWNLLWMSWIKSCTIK